MLHFILGTAGSGKTDYIFRSIVKDVKKEKKVIFLVPEQFSFEAERELFYRLHSAVNSGVEVLTFTRLCNNIFRATGGLAGNYINDTARTLLLSSAIDENSSDLKYYQSKSADAGFIFSMLQMLNELKTYGVTADHLLQCASMQQGIFADKLSDIALLYRTYDAMVHQNYIDDYEDLFRAAKNAEETGYFKDYVVYIDSFVAFSGDEYRMLQAIIRDAKEIYCSICSDGLYDDEKGYGLFSTAKKTIARIHKIAKDNAVTVEKPLILTTPYRFHKKALRHLEQNFMRTIVEKSEDIEGIVVFKADDVYEEIEAVASNIKKLVRNGYRYRDIAVIARDLDVYQLPIYHLFAEYDIPFFMDDSSSIVQYPLVRGVLLALEAVLSGFSVSSILSLMKTPLFSFTLEEISLFENYCYTWGVQGKNLGKPFVDHPKGLAIAQTSIEEEQLQKINKVRELLYDALSAFKQRLQHCNGKKFAHAIYQFLLDIQATEHLFAFASGLEDGEAFLKENAAVWDNLIDILDAFEVCLAPKQYSLRKFYELLLLIAKNTTINTIPQTLDQVIVGMADRIRPMNPKAVFVIGATEGVFPAVFTNTSILSDQERTELLNAGLSLAASSDEIAVREKYFAYFALTCASEKVFISYPTSNMVGGGLYASTIVLQVLGMFHGLKETTDVPAELRVVNRKTAIRAFADSLKKSDSISGSIYYLFDTDFQRKIDKIITNATQRNDWVYQTGILQKLCGEHLTLSPTRIELYYKCPFAYFCKSVLKIEPRKKVEYSPIASGSVIHECFEKLLKQHTPEQLLQMPEKALKGQIYQIISDYLEKISLEKEFLTNKFLFLFHQLTDRLYYLVIRLSQELLQSKFVPKEFELPINTQSIVKPLELVTPDGHQITVQGVVDRLDVYERDGEKFVRVIDYKSGGKEFKLSDVYYGLNMQMLIYLFAVCNHDEKITPAGVLYMPAKYDLLKTTRDISPEKLEKMRSETLRMDGLVIDDEDVITAMEKDVAGVFIPVSRTKKGFSKTSAIASLSEFGQIKQFIEQTILKMASEFYHGNIKARPVKEKNRKQCEFCDYWSVCLNQNTEDTVDVTSFSKEDFFAKITKEPENERTKMDTTTE